MAGICGSGPGSTERRFGVSKKGDPGIAFFVPAGWAIGARQVRCRAVDQVSWVEMTVGPTDGIGKFG